MDIQQNKVAIRKQIELKRSQLSEQERREKEIQINQKLIQFCQQRCPSTVLAYMPFRSEVDISPFVDWCWASEVRVLLPRIVSQTKTLCLHVVQSYRDVHMSTWGIREPHPNTPVEEDIENISLIVIPGIAFDRDMGRLGYGGGYYDRFMQLFTDRGKPYPYTVSVAFEIQIVPNIPRTWHDFHIEHLITE